MGTTRICRMGFDLQDVDALSCAIGIGIGTILAFLLTSFSKAKPTPVNPSIQKDSPKVATMTTVQEVGDTVNASEKGVVAYCRCWRSSKFPVMARTQHTIRRLVTTLAPSSLKSEPA